MHHVLFVFLFYHLYYKADFGNLDNIISPDENT